MRKIKTIVAPGREAEEKKISKTAAPLLALLL
jgi:hypothetical protein